MSLMKKSVLPVVLLAAMPILGQAAELGSLEERFSYALGYQFAQQLKSQGLDVRGEAFGAALDDVLQEKELQLNVDQMRLAIQETREKINQQKAQQAQAALEAGEKYLGENLKKEGVKASPSGLQYKVLRAGEGATPPDGASVTVHYRGTLINGKEFDSSYARGEPATFALTGVIPGFREGLSMMSKGAKWALTIPAELGYGSTGVPGSIGPNEVLLFEVELLSFEAPEAEKAEDK